MRNGSAFIKEKEVGLTYSWLFLGGKYENDGTESGEMFVEVDPKKKSFLHGQDWQNLK